ncbi:MAG: TlpA disulfide reductase family protein [Saprospiraceae bacterium]|nr:TlpA disulfide reductase family protein [Saprospiraceae bacterium]
MKNTRTIGIVALLLFVAFLFYKYRMPRFKAGEQTPDFEVTLISGEQARLSDLRGKFVLLQFWGSWCGSCRKENPELVELYNKYHERGFEIFSIGVEPNERSWKRAIEQDQMRWKYHAMESSEFDGLQTQLFNVKSIPATFLLNREGVIMGVNLKPHYMDKMLSEKI